MKRNMKKFLGAALVLTTVLTLFTACGQQGDSSTGSGNAMSDDDYYKIASTLAQTFSDQTSDLTTTMMAKDVKADSIATKITEGKKVFADFASVTAPQKFAEADKQFKEGCKNAVSYYDALSKSLSETDSDKQFSAQQDAEQYKLTAQSCFSEGTGLLETAVGNSTSSSATGSASSSSTSATPGSASSATSSGAGTTSNAATTAPSTTTGTTSNAATTDTGAKSTTTAPATDTGTKSTATTTAPATTDTGAKSTATTTAPATTDTGAKSTATTTAPATTNTGAASTTAPAGTATTTNPNANATKAQ